MLEKRNLGVQWAPGPLRLVMGIGFMNHGWAKWNRGPEDFGKLLHQLGLSLPELTAWAVTILESAGGLARLVMHRDRLSRTIDCRKEISFSLLRSFRTGLRREQRRALHFH